MKRSNKKGFTIVELVIVIAVIAILAAVLIPTFAGVIKKAQMSSDQSAVRNMNTVLAGEVEKPNGILDVAKVLDENGFNITAGLVPSYKNHSYYWFKPTNQVVYVSEENGAFDLLYPEDVKNFNKDDCQPLATRFPQVTATVAPSVTSTTVTVSNAETTIDIPDTVNSFESLVAWTNENNFNGKEMMTMINGAMRGGVTLSGGTIKLNADITLGEGRNKGNSMNYNIVEDTTIDLNGHTITQYPGSGLSYALFMIRDGATLNIIDSSEAKTGAIKASLAAFQVDAGGTLNLYSGKICVASSSYRSGADTENGVYLVELNGGTFNMFGGTLDATSDSNNSLEYAVDGYGISTSLTNLFNGSIIGKINTDKVGLIYQYDITITDTQ